MTSEGLSILVLSLKNVIVENGIRNTSLSFFSGSRFPEFHFQDIKLLVQLILSSSVCWKLLVVALVSLGQRKCRFWLDASFSFSDLADWLGVGEIGLFNFKPSVRPVPIEVHIQVSQYLFSSLWTNNTLPNENFIYFYSVLDYQNFNLLSCLLPFSVGGL